jgi:hypothetical protein
VKKKERKTMSEEIVCPKCQTLTLSKEMIRGVCFWCRIEEILGNDPNNPETQQDKTDVMLFMIRSLAEFDSDICNKTAMQMFKILDEALSNGERLPAEWDHIKINTFAGFNQGKGMMH